MFVTSKNPLARPDGQSFSYDAWNRLASHTLNGTTSSFDETTQYRYDALGRRVSETTTIGGGGGGIGITDGTLELYYSDRWQVIHERRAIEGGGGTFGGGEEPGPEGFGFGSYEQQTDYVWSLRYVDALAARNHDADLSDFNGLEQRLYVQHDANFNVTAITDDDGDVLERFIYDPYGWATYLDPNWTVDAGGSDYGWVYLHQGGRWQAESGVYHFRHRDYDPVLGRWVQQDPAGYVDGANLYQAVRGTPVSALDPSGLELIFQPGPRVTQEEADRLMERMRGIVERTEGGLRELLDELMREGNEQITVQVTRNDPRVMIDDYNRRRLDLADLEKLPTDGGANTQDAALLHMAVEQAWGGPYNEAHPVALDAETAVTGRRIDEILPRGGRPHGKWVMLYKCGCQWIRQTIRMRNGDIVGVEQEVIGEDPKPTYR